jgi:hypothetical protein
MSLSHDYLARLKILDSTICKYPNSTVNSKHLLECTRLPKEKQDARDKASL